MSNHSKHSTIWSVRPTRLRTQLNWAVRRAGPEMSKRTSQVIHSYTNHRAENSYLDFDRNTLCKELLRLSSANKTIIVVFDPTTFNSINKWIRTPQTGDPDVINEHFWKSLSGNFLGISRCCEIAAAERCRFTTSHRLKKWSFYRTKAKSNRATTFPVKLTISTNSPTFSGSGDPRSFEAKTGSDNFFFTEANGTFSSTKMRCRTVWIREHSLVKIYIRWHHHKNGRQNSKYGIEYPLHQHFLENGEISAKSTKDIISCGFFHRISQLDNSKAD